MTTSADRIMIYGPKDDGTYIVEFRMATGESLGTVAHWLKLLVAADVIYVVAGLLTFDVLLEG